MCVREREREKERVEDSTPWSVCDLPMFGAGGGREEWVPEKGSRVSLSSSFTGCWGGGERRPPQGNHIVGWGLCWLLKGTRGTDLGGGAVHGLAGSPQTVRGCESGSCRPAGLIAEPMVFSVLTEGAREVVGHVGLQAEGRVCWSQSHFIFLLPLPPRLGFRMETSPSCS